MTFESFVRSEKKGLGLLLVILLLLSVLYYRKTVNEFPQFIHAWAEGDYYALAQNFTTNGHNFFKPETYCLNPEFGPGNPIPSPRGITAVDFPLVPYLVGWLMEVFGMSPWVFRLTTLLVSLAGFTFLFRLAFRLTGNAMLSVFASVFAFTNPVLTYYQAGFIATVPALAFSFAGMFYYVRHVDGGRMRDFVTAIALVTLASLMRTPFCMVLVALCGVELLKMLKRRGLSLAKISALGGGMALVLLYFCYNRYLRFLYGSVFLGQPEPAQSLQDFFNYCKSSYDMWFWDFITGKHLLVLLVCVVAAAAHLLASNTALTRAQKHLALFTTLLFCGALFYGYMMAPKFVHHDYYFLDTFFIPLVMILILALSLVSKARYAGSVLVSIILLVIVGFLYHEDYRKQRYRRHLGFFVMTEEIAKSFSGADLYLDSLKVGREARILAWETASSNIPHILMQRKGYCVIYLDKNAMEQSLALPFDYLVLDEVMLEEHFLPVFPGLYDVLDKVGSNGKIGVYRKKKVGE